MSHAGPCRRTEACARASRGRRESLALRLLGGSLAIVLALLPSAAASQELVLGVAGDYTFNSNFFSASNNPDEANSFQIGPVLALNDAEGRLQYEFSYDGRYQAYADQDGVNAWESRLRARVSYDLTDRTRIRVTERFRDISNLRFSRSDIAVADTALDPNQDRYFRNDLELELIHDLTSLLELRLRGEHHWVDFRQNRDRNDNQTWTAASELRYQVEVNHFVGAGLSYSRQNFEAAFSRFGSRAQYVNAYGTWTWIVSDAFTVTVNGGPAWVRSDEKATSSVEQTQFVGGEVGGQTLIAQFQSCAVDPARGEPVASNCLLGAGANSASNLGAVQRFGFSGAQSRVRSDSALTFFGGMTLAGSIDVWNVQATYQRRQTTTTGDGLASSLDRIFVEFEYAPPKYRWSAFVAGSWDRRESLTDSTVIDFELVNPAPPTSNATRETAFTRVESNSSVRDNFTALAGFRYRLEENFAGTLDARYRRTEIDGIQPSRPGIDTFFVVLSFEYDLDPIQL